MTSPTDPKDPKAPSDTGGKADGASVTPLRLVPHEQESIDLDAMVDLDGVDPDDFRGADDGWAHPEEIVLLAALRLPDAGEPGGPEATEDAIEAVCNELDPGGHDLSTWLDGAAAFDLGELVGPPGRLRLRAVCFVEVTSDEAPDDDEVDLDDPDIDEDYETVSELVAYLVARNDDHVEVLASTFLDEVAPHASTPQDRMRLASLLLDGLAQLEPEGLRLSLLPRFAFLARPYDPIQVGENLRPEDRAAARAERIKAHKRRR